MMKGPKIKHSELKVGWRQKKKVYVKKTDRSVYLNTKNRYLGLHLNFINTTHKVYVSAACLTTRLQPIRSLKPAGGVSPVTTICVRSTFMQCPCHKTISIPTTTTEKRTSTETTWGEDGQRLSTFWNYNFITLLYCRQQPWYLAKK